MSNIACDKMGDEATSGQDFQWALTNGDIDQVKTCINEVNYAAITPDLAGPGVYSLPD